MGVISNAQEAESMKADALAYRKLRQDTTAEQTAKAAYHEGKALGSGQLRQIAEAAYKEGSRSVMAELGLGRFSAQEETPVYIPTTPLQNH